MDKHACHKLAKDGYKKALWPESYITWEFLAAHPKSMEFGYLNVEWNTIPGLYSRKDYMRTLVIERKEWDHLSDPAQLERYWEPTQDSDFHWTLRLALCWTPFHDCADPGCRKEFVVSVAVMQKPSRHVGLPFSNAAEEFWDNTDMTPTLLLVRLHWKSSIFPDIYYDRYGKHFTIMHDTGQGHNMGDPQKFLRALLHNAYSSGNHASPKAKLPLAYMGMPAYSPPIDSCSREYSDWSGEWVPEGGKRSPPEEHFVWLSKDNTPYDTDPGSPFVPPDFTLGLPPVRDWPHRARHPPWILDPEEYPKLDHKVPVDSTGVSSMDEGKKKKKKKKKKKHRHSKKSDGLELKVTTRGEGANTVVWTITASPKDSSSSSSSQSNGDSSMGSSIQPRRGTDTEP